MRIIRGRARFNGTRVNLPTRIEFQIPDGTISYRRVLVDLCKELLLSCELFFWFFFVRVNVVEYISKGDLTGAKVCLKCVVKKKESIIDISVYNFREYIKE